MKKKLLLCSLLCLLAAATSVAASDNLANSTDTETQKSTASSSATATQTSSPTTLNTPTETTPDQSFTRINLFGNSIGIYHLGWEFEVTQTREEKDQQITTDSDSADGDYIDNNNCASDQSMMLDLTIPLGENGNALQVKVGFDVRQANPLIDNKSTTATETTATETTNKPITTVQTTPQTTTKTVPVTPTTIPSTTQKPITTTAPTTAAPTTATPTTQTPTTAAPTTATPTTQAPTTKAPTTTKKTSNESGAVPETVPAFDYTEEEYDLLARIIHCEAGGEELEGMIAVGTVVMNRVESSKFPNNIHDVIFQKGQFTPALSGKIYRITPNQKSCEAARRVLEGERTDTRILYFRSSKYASEPWMNGQRKLIITIDKQSFYS